jgi:uncharacterized protein (DUF305 family)
MTLRHSTPLLLSALGAIALSVTLTACETRANSSHSSATSMDHGAMNHDGMNHGQQPQQGDNAHSMSHGMDLGPADADYDLRFIDAMIPHHEGAVSMAQDLAQKTKRPELQQLAKNIIAEQRQEIAQMKQWRKQWYPQAAATPMAWHAQMNHMMPMSTAQVKAMRMDLDLGVADAAYDLRFLEAMVPHHEAAVVMAKDLAQKSKRPELQTLGKAIIKSQQAEIEQMKQWQKTWYPKP